MSEFKDFGKIARWDREVIVTEKIDGTNSCIAIQDGKIEHVQSRKRIITLNADNYGFAKWAYENEKILIEILGDGYHYGEWWGQSIRRRYGMNRKQFSLFNTTRWEGLQNYDRAKDIGLYVVPVLFKGLMKDLNVNNIMTKLKETGSVAAKGYMNPEGIVIFHSQNYALFKKTFEYDEKGKGQIG